MLPHLHIKHFERKNVSSGGTDIERQTIVAGSRNRSEVKDQTFGCVPTVGIDRLLGDHLGTVDTTCRQNGKA